MASILDQIKAASQLYNTTGLNVLGTNVHKGSWGLPDLGVTEALASTGSGGTTQDLSNALAGYPVTSSGQVYGDNFTSNNTTNAPTSGSTGGTLGTTTDVPNVPSNNEPSVPSLEDQLRSGIGSAYDSYLSDLDNILMSGLPAQQSIQNQMIESQYGQGVNTLDTQKTLGLSDLSTEEQKIQKNQVKTLADVSSNIRNLMQAGNTYLGARGAGDSSAVNQYSYALTKLGSQQRGNILSQTQDMLSQVNDRKFKLNTMYNSELFKLQSSRDEKVLGVMSWFGEQQNNLKLMKAEVGFNRQQDLNNITRTLLDQAIAKVNSINAETQNRRLALEQWAMNNSTTLAQLQKNLQSVSDWKASNIMYSPLTMNGMVQGGQQQQPLAYGGYSGADEEDLFS